MMSESKFSRRKRKKSIMKQQSILKYLKRKGSPLEGPSSSAKRMKLEVEEAHLNDAQRPKNKVKRYSKGGLVHSLHGTIYQLKVLMLFLKRAIDKGYQFDLGTEVEDAEKFDDIVFKYQSVNDKIYFVQAKHKQDDSRKIMANDLMTKNASGNDFSLQKYFVSFSKIRQHPAFSDYESKDFFIYTNIDFNYSDLDKAEIRLEKIEKYDEFLHINQSTKITARYKFIVREDHMLYQALVETSDLHILADKLMEHLLDNNVPIKMSDDIWKRYHVALTSTVFTPVKDEPLKKIKANSKKSINLIFRDDFIEDEGLSEKVGKFRQVLETLFDKNKNNGGVNFKTKLREFKIRAPTNFGEEFKENNEPFIDNPKELATKIVEYSRKANKENVFTIKCTTNDIDKLAGHVLVLDNKGILIRFRTRFFDENYKLPGNLRIFKKALKKELGENFDKLSECRCKINNYITLIETSEGKLLTDYERELPSDTIDSEIITDFFKNFIFAVNQPNEVELGNIIADEFEESCQFNVLSGEQMYDSLQKKLLDWFKEKGKIKGQEGRYLNYESVQDIFNSIERKVNKIICEFLSLPVRDELKKHDITFNENDIRDRLQNFLNEYKDASNASPKVLHLVTPKNSLLTDLKVYSALENLKQQDAQFKKQEYSIFMKLSRLLQLESQRHALGAFQARCCQNLLIVICDSACEENEVQELYDKLKKILWKVNKPIILIGEEDNILVRKFPTDQLRKYESNTKFNQLSNQSKKKLLQKEVVFQGRGRSVELKQLFSKMGSKRLLSERLNVIDSETLVQLINSNKIIRIGKRLLGKSDLEGAYNKLYELINKDTLIEILREHANSIEYFVISGLDGDDKETLITDLNINETQTCKLALKNGKVIPIKDIKKIIFADSKFEEKSFKQLCHNYPNKHFQWIKWKDSKFIQHSLYNPRFMKRQFKYPNKITFSDDIKAELLNSSEDNVFFLTGVESPEQLFEILELQDDQTEQETLEKQLRSGKIIVQSSSSKNETEFNDLAKEKAEQNKTAYWLDVNSDSIEKPIIWRDVTRKIILEEELISTLESQSSIIIDKPGMGKSTTLAILAEKILKTHWVIFITFRDWQEVINNLPDNINSDTVIDFLSDTKNVNSPAERNLAKFLLDKNCEGGVKPLLFMFDGFDEIRSYDVENAGKKKAEEFLRYLKHHTRSTIWITAREQDAIQLQNILSLFCVKFEPLKKNEHCDYFKDFWMNSLKLSVTREKFSAIFSDEDSKFLIYYDALAKAADVIFSNKDNDFMGIPLTLRLFAEGFQNKFKNFACTDEDQENFAKDFDNLSILNLYKYFVDSKLKIFICEKTNLSTGFSKISEDWFREKLIKFHCRLAFKELFGSEETKELLGLKNPFKGPNNDVDNVQLNELLNVGIIRSIKAEHYEFLHRTVAEYFTSRLLIYILKNKQHNNLAKYNRTVQFLRKNFLKQSNEIIKKFLNAGLQHDEKLRVVLQPIKNDIEFKNLLGQASSKYKFILNAHRPKSPGDLDKMKQEMESILQSVDVSLRGKTRAQKKEEKSREKMREAEINKFKEIFSNFKSSFVYEARVEELQNFLKYLMDTYSNVVNSKIDVHLRDNIVEFISHYILQAEEKNKLNKDFLENCIKAFFAKFKQKNSKFFNWSLENKSKTTKEVEKIVTDDKSYKTVVEAIFASGILTTKMAETIISRFSKHLDAIKMIFGSLISPLLSYKHHCPKYSFTFVNNINSVALLNVFQEFAFANKRQKTTMDLSEASLEGLLLCIKDLLDPVTFSEENFTVSVKALMALEHWNFQLLNQDFVLNLSHTHGYSSQLNLKYEEDITEILKFRNNNPEKNFDDKLACVVNSLSVSTSAESI